MRASQNVVAGVNNILLTAQCVEQQHFVMLFVPESCWPLRPPFETNLKQLTLKIRLRRYKHIFGLSGTLGDADEHRYLADCYAVDICKLQPHKRNRLDVLAGEMLSSMDQEAWRTRIVSSVADFHRRGRAVLIICRSELDATYLAESIAGARVYVRKDLVNPPQNIDVGEVLISTNLAGRGTDLAISEALEANGGLHACLAYLPDNERIQRQAFGRAARKGQPGSAQIIAWTGHCKRLRFHNEVRFINPNMLFQVFDQATKQLEGSRVRLLNRSSRGEDIVEECFVSLLQLVSAKRIAFRSARVSEDAAAVVEAGAGAAQIEAALASMGVRAPDVVEKKRAEILEKHRTKSQLAARSFEKFAFQVVMERFSFWKKEHESALAGPECEAVQATFSRQFLPQCTALLDSLCERLHDTSYEPSVVPNPFTIIDKGMIHGAFSHDRAAADLFTCAIANSPEFSAFAYFNRAFSRIRLEDFDAAVSDLDAAEKQIMAVDLAQIAAIEIGRAHV